MTDEILTQDKLKELLSYDPEIGVFLWKNPKSTKVKAGDVAGWNSKKKWGVYKAMTLLGKTYYSHRLVFLYMTGKFPPQLVDHIDGDGLNNKFCNLRCVTPSENNQNQKRRSDNKSGTIGISWYQRDKTWAASICLNGKTKFLGRFKEMKEAVKVRKEAEIRYGFSDGHGADR